MPAYDFKCPECEFEDEYILSYSRYDETKESPLKCPTCQSDMIQVIGAPCINIPASMTYNGQHKFVGSTSKKTNGIKKRDLQVPVNIIDEKPGGGYRVTRIGRKKDIDND